MPVLFILASLAIIALSTWSIMKGLRDGEVPYKTFLSFSRDDQPALFWTILWLHALIGTSVAAALLVGGLWMMAD